MKTSYQVLRTNGSVFHGSTHWPEQPSTYAINTLVQRFCPGPTVMTRLIEDGHARDLYMLNMDKTRLSDGTINARASALYRDYLLAQDPSLDPLATPPVVGTAVLFARALS